MRRPAATHAPVSRAAPDSIDRACLPVSRRSIAGTRSLLRPTLRRASGEMFARCRPLSFERPPSIRYVCSTQQRGPIPPDVPSQPAFPGEISMTAACHPIRVETASQRAARYAMFTGALAGAHQGSVAIAQEAAADNIDEIVLTGTRIRRVDEETASPVQVVDSALIEQSGVQTIGQLMQRLPAIGGQATNPSTNNGGGDGASNVELRGLGVERTLVLLNGRRYGALGNLTSAVDINSIPVNMIERVEVLKQGAGAIYGSDAIGGVVNFITKRKTDGLELGLDWGRSAESDGSRKGISLTWGTEGERGSVVVGMNYNQQDSISAGNRAFSANAIYFYGSVFEGGSSRVPGGRMFLDTTNTAGLRAQYGGCSSVTRNAGAPGGSLNDFRCYQTTGANNDAYNYQPLNLILTPQERASVFTTGNFQVTDNIELYTEFLYNYTTSGFQIAPLPFDSRSDNVVIAANNLYNPFGVSFGGQTPDALTGALNPNATFRLEALGNRRSKVDSYQGQITGGLRGELFSTGWTWDASLAYSRLDQDTKVDGYLFKSGLTNALGPSFIDPATGRPACGVPGAAVSGCVPVNIFNLGDASQVDALRTISAGYNQNYKYWMKTGNLNFAGDLFELTAGKVQAAVGFEYRDQVGRFDTDFLTQSSAPLYKDCLLQGETCSGDQNGGFDVKEYYAEVLIPLVKDAPFAKTLNLTVGGRRSDYSTFGSTTNGTYQIEWRPVNDLLVRASYADIFRAPTIIDLYQAPTANAATFTDPCVGLTPGNLAANANLALACRNVTPNGTFQQPNSQVDGLFIGGTFVPGSSLRPEEGEAVTFGFVYEPAFARGLTATVDYWSYKIDNVITQVDVNTTAEQCALTGSAQFCGYLNRFPDGTILQILQPTINLGSLETSGVDLGLMYRMAETGAGNFRFGIDATYTDKYDSEVIAGGPVTKVAGFYDRQYGNIAKWRLMGQLGWDLKDFSALLIARYIDSVSLTDPDGAPGTQPNLNVPSVTYLDLTAGYRLPWTGTRLQVGVNNLTDKQPPILYQNNVLNANTDVATYDTVGRYFFATLSHKF
jgi:iron complex outermembrane recepter protein